MRSKASIALLVMGVVAFAFPAMPQAAIYRWQDTEGNLHFTDDLTKVPPSYRERMEVEDLPEEPKNVTPSTPPPSEPETKDQPGPADAYAECQKKVGDERKRWGDQLQADQERLVELDRLIHRTVTARQKNEYQRERVAVQDRISQAEQVLRDTLPPKEQECESIRYWQNTE